MRKTIMIFCGALLLVGVSCQKKQEASFATDNVQMADIHHLVVNGDSTFTGEVWDEDHRQCVELEKGEKSKVSITHANGQTAAVYVYASDGREAESHFYDEDGKEISKKDFALRYRELIYEFGTN